MKRTVTGTIGHRSFIIEEDAWAELENYLNALRKVYRREPEHLEIVRDIEERISEYLWEWKGASGKVIVLSDILRVEKIIGVAEDLSGEREHAAPSPRKGPRKLYRDPDHRVFGGVCSGMSYYFNADVVLIRVIAIVLFFLGFLSFWVYLILWLVIPKAITRAQKLEMRGIAVTPENLNRYC